MAVDMFIKIGPLKGESRDAKYNGKDGWIDVLAFSWGASNSGTAHLGAGSGAGKANFQDLTITKYVDLASPDLLKGVSKGTHWDDAQLIVRKAGDNPLDYLVMDMKDVMVVGYSTGGSGGEDRFTESVTLNFDWFNYKYTEQMKDGSAGSSPEFAWSIASQAEEMS